MSRQTISSYPQVIVAGMPRTDTESIKRALEILYGNGARAYHMTEVLNRPKHLEIWSDLAFGRCQVDQLDWKRLLDGYIATTDMPCALYFKELTDVPRCDFPRLNAGTSGPSKTIAKAVRQLSLNRILIAVGIVFVFSIILLLITMSM